MESKHLETKDFLAKIHANLPENERDQVKIHLKRDKDSGSANLKISKFHDGTEEVEQPYQLEKPKVNLSAVMRHPVKRNPPNIQRIHRAIGSTMHRTGDIKKDVGETVKELMQSQSESQPVSAKHAVRSTYDSGQGDTWKAPEEFHNGVDSVKSAFRFARKKLEGQIAPAGTDVQRDDWGRVIGITTPASKSSEEPRKLPPVRAEKVDYSNIMKNYHSGIEMAGEKQIPQQRLKRIARTAPSDKLDKALKSEAMRQEYQQHVGKEPGAAPSPVSPGFAQDVQKQFQGLHNGTESVMASDKEQEAAQLSKERGMAASKLPPEKKAAYIAEQGRLESKRGGMSALDKSRLQSENMAVTVSEGKQGAEKYHNGVDRVGEIYRASARGEMKGDPVRNAIAQEAMDKEIKKKADIRYEGWPATHPERDVQRLGKPPSSEFATHVKEGVEGYKAAHPEKYHNGNAKVLGKNDVPAILEKGERVLSKDDNKKIGKMSNMDLVKSALMYKKPAMMAHEPDAEPPKPEKKLKEIRIRKSKNGGHIIEHHFTHPETHQMEEHISSNMGELHGHLDNALAEEAEERAEHASASGGE